MKTGEIAHFPNEMLYIEISCPLDGKTISCSCVFYLSFSHLSVLNVKHCWLC